MTESTLYVYAVVPAESFQPRVAGIDGAELQVLGPEGGPHAVVHSHTTRPYEGPDEHVKRWILQHSDVVEDCWAALGTVLPVTFNVIVQPEADSGSSAAAQLESWLRTSADHLHRRLDTLTDTCELRVEISLDRSGSAAHHPEVEELRAQMAERPPGVRRLLEKKLEKTEQELSDQAADALYPDCRSRIAAHCLEIDEYKRAPRVDRNVPVLMAACLVSSADVQSLGAELSQIQAEQPSATIRFLGPWPPYSFTEMTGDMTGDAADEDTELSGLA